VPIIKTVAASGQGIAELADKLAAHRDFLRASGQLTDRSGRQARSEMLALLNQALLARVAATVGTEEWERLIEDVVARRADPYSAADQIARRIGLVPSPSTIP